MLEAHIRHVGIARERDPSRAGVVARNGEVALSLELVELRIEPRGQFVDARRTFAAVEFIEPTEAGIAVGV